MSCHLVEKMKIKSVEKLVRNLKQKKEICGTYQDTRSSAKAWFKI